MKKLSGSLCMDRCTDNHHGENEKYLVSSYIFTRASLNIGLDTFRAISNLDVSLGI